MDKPDLKYAVVVFRKKEFVFDSILDNKLFTTDMKAQRAIGRAEMEDIRMNLRDKYTYRIICLEVEE